jgi:nitrogen fixation/metabolism regulation signal transduction histidine kinase
MGFFRRYQVPLLLLTGFLVLMTLLVLFVPFLNSLPAESRSSSTVIFIVTLFVFTLLAFFIILRTSLRPFREIADEAQIIANLGSRPKTQNESEFVMETFQSVLTRLQDQQHELEILNEEVSLRALTAERFSEKIVASLPSGIIAFNSEGLTQTINLPARELLEIRRKTDNIHFSELLENYPELSEMIAQCLNDGEVFLREEVSGHNSDNRLLRLGVTVAPVDDARAEMQEGVLCLLADLTEVKELREQLALKQNLESLGEMSAGIAHEFKNSLGALQSYAQLFQRIEVDERGKLAAGQLLLEVRNLSEMTTAFLDFARPKPLNLAEVSLSELLNECANELSGLFSKRQIEILISGTFGVVEADERMLRQTLLNLMRNAVEAIADDAAVKKVFVKGAVQKDKAGQLWSQIEIADTGGGISARDLSMIFVPFFTTKDKGHGIGLALSHRVISQHGGSLAAANSENGGAIFTVELKAVGGS